MQHIFPTQVTPKEYFNLGTDFPFPKPKTCPNPSCHVPRPPKGHGYYERNILTLEFEGRILIRRYYCPYCKHTFSYLPSFCLPYFQYSLELIFYAIFFHFFKWAVLLMSLIPTYPVNWCVQHQQFYAKRFLNNRKLIQVGLRQLLAEVQLPDWRDITKGAQDLLTIVVSGFEGIQAFSQRFFQQCNCSFMAPCKLL
ncbi:MAG: DUF6431 domain-containing protein [Desulfitobacterium hafniense]|nr:DUF6431 domain-containing protein [Desulfitobacterium hafniense]